MKRIEELYNTYFHDVYLYIKALSQNDETAQEITQETFFKAMKSIDSFKGNCSVKTWLCQIAKNIYLNQCRSNKHNDSGELSEDTADITICFQDTLEDSEQSLKIHRILHKMDEPYKEVFSLRIFSELSFRDIASLFGKNESWARVTFHRAKLKIIDKLSNQDREE
ncbi:MAG: RNA polymerase sigma factor [Oscillospiraceae bacterium]|nr:RNA polymerase sigma factor [Oscillospiraceae bacterium]